MINEQYSYIAFGLLALSIVIIMASVIIPIRFYHRKRWKGLAIGCLLQPIICALLIFLLFFGFIGFHEYKLHRQKENAMVTLSVFAKDSLKTDTTTWYVTAGDECIVEINRRDRSFDVIRLDKSSVGVEDRIVVKFDVKKKQISATDFGKPVKVDSVDWEQVKNYLDAK